jgi:hypothetical protein
MESNFHHTMALRSVYVGGITVLSHVTPPPRPALGTRQNAAYLRITVACERGVRRNFLLILRLGITLWLRANKMQEKEDITPHRVLALRCGA